MYAKRIVTFLNKTNNKNLYHGYKIAIKFRRAEIFLPFVIIIIDYFQSALDGIGSIRSGSFSYVRRSTFVSLSLSLVLFVSLPFFPCIFILIWRSLKYVGSCPTINYTSIYRAMTEIYHGYPRNEIYWM